MNRVTKFIDLGRRSYRDVWKQQEELLETVKEQKKQGEPTSNYLLFVEHDPVYTLGRSGKNGNMLMDAVQLRAKHAEYIQVDRGGDITFHGPGQLVVYPVIDMENFSLGVKDYVNDLEEVVIKSLSAYGMKGQRLPGATGVWLDASAKTARKICAIGVRCSQYVTMHGFALNVNTDLDYFNYIHPCGFVDKGVTSMQKELGKEMDMQEVKNCVKNYFVKIFGMEF